MNDVLVLAVKAVDGGLFVVLFALAGKAFQPKWFAGLFSAAPSVALANLLVVVVAKGHPDAVRNSIGMLFGAAGFVVFCVVARSALERFSALIASLLACLAWAVTAFGLYAVVLR
jgi:uncharacterized membrane protein (GlpM family)